MIAKRDRFVTCWLFANMTIGFYIHNAYLTQIDVWVYRGNPCLLSELLWMNIIRNEQSIAFMNLRYILFNDRSKPGIGLARLLIQTYNLKEK